MDYKEFVDWVAEDLRAKFPDALVMAQQVDKLQEGSYYGICVKPKESRVGVSLDLAAAYAQLEFGIPYEETLDDIVKDVQTGIRKRPNLSVNNLGDYSSMKEKLMVQVIPMAGNENMLAKIPHTKCEDMAIVYRFVLDINDRGMTSSSVTNSMLDGYGITKEQLHADAVENAAEKFPVKLRNMNEMMAEMMGIAPEMMPEQEPEMYVVTNNKNVCGASCIFYPGFMEQAAEKIGGDFFVLPSSIHEVLLLPVREPSDIKELESTVREINQAEVEPKDRLSNSVYHYDAKERIFETVKSFEMRQLAKAVEKEHSGKTVNHLKPKKHSRGMGR